MKRLFLFLLSVSLCFSNDLHDAIKDGQSIDLKSCSSEDLISLDDNGDTPLMIAVKFQNLRAVQDLAFYKHGLNIEDKRGRTPLMCAKHSLITAILLANGASLENSKGWSVTDYWSKLKEKKRGFLSAALGTKKSRGVYAVPTELLIRYQFSKNGKLFEEEIIRRSEGSRRKEVEASKAQEAERSRFEILELTRFMCIDAEYRREFYEAWQKLISEQKYLPIRNLFNDERQEYIYLTQFIMLGVDYNLIPNIIGYCKSKESESFKKLGDSIEKQLKEQSEG